MARRGCAPSKTSEHGGLMHAFSVDVEDWYQGIPVSDTVKASAERRLEHGLNQLLELMAEHGSRGTFFILGPLVQTYPQAMKRIADAGHEIGCHGWSHDLLYHMTPARFGEETREARDWIADLVGRPLTAYRAAYFSVTRQSMGALEILASLGFHYDSSIFPVKNWRYVIEDFSRDPVLIETSSGPIWEFPISVMTRYGRTMPVSGGAYFRMYPYALTRSNLRVCEQAGRSVILYLHPWELDPERPRVNSHWKPRLTHYINLRSTAPKLGLPCLRAQSATAPRAALAGNRQRIRWQVPRSDVHPGVLVHLAAEKAAAIGPLLTDDLHALDELLAIDEQRAAFASRHVLRLVKLRVEAARSSRGAVVQ